MLEISMCLKILWLLQVKMTIVWIKNDKTLCCSEKDLLIGLCYIIPDESSRHSMTETNIFDRLLSHKFFLKTNTVEIVIFAM